MPLTIKTPPSLVGFKDTRATPKALEVAVETLKSIIPQQTTFASITKDGQTRQASGSCHYHAPHLFHSEESRQKRSVFVTDTNFKSKAGDLSKKELEDLKGPFLKWFLYDSPFSFLIINKDDYDFCRDYGFIFSYDAPFQYFHGACIVSRHFREVSLSGFKTFNLLVQEKGIDPLIAFTLCMSSNISSGGSIDSAFSSHSSHRLGAPLNLRNLKNAYSGNPVVDISKSYFVNPSIIGSSALFRDNSNSVCLLRLGDPVFDGLIREARGEKEVGVYRPPNPFKNKGNYFGVNMDERFTVKEAIEVLAPYYQQEIEKWAKEEKHV